MLTGICLLRINKLRRAVNILDPDEVMKILIREQLKSGYS